MPGAQLGQYNMGCISTLSVCLTQQAPLCSEQHLQPYTADLVPSPRGMVTARQSLKLVSGSKPTYPGYRPVTLMGWMLLAGMRALWQ